MGQDIVFPIWTYRTAGFLRAFIRDPAGHDYPKREYPDKIKGHRSVVLLDTIDSWVPQLKYMKRKLFDREALEADITFDGLTQYVYLHETCHGMQIKQNLKVGNGQTLAEAFGSDWGALVEPWADVGAGILCTHMEMKNEERPGECLTAMALASVLRLRERKKVTKASARSDMPHVVGSNLMVGKLWANNALERNAEGLLTLNLERTKDTLNEMFEKLSGFAAQGDREGFLVWLDEGIKQVDLDLEKSIVRTKKGAPPYVILDRGGLQKPSGSDFVFK